MGCALRRGSAWWLALWICLPSCSCETSETAVMVEVDSDIPLAEMDRVRVQIDSVGDGDVRTRRLDTEYVLAERAPDEPGGSIPGRSEVRLPIRIAVFPRDSTQAVIRVGASGMRPGAPEPSVEASARLAFVPGRSLLLRVVLYRVCVDVSCEEEQTCLEITDTGLCVDEEVRRPECQLPDLEAGRVEGCADACTTAADCDDETDCTEDLCRNGACEHTAACGGATPVCCDGACAACCGDAECDDGLPCTADTCDAGACAHTSVCECLGDEDCGGGLCCDGACAGCCADADCDDDDACTDDVCVAGGCTHPDHVCPDDGSPCTTEACELGSCQTKPVCGDAELCCDGTCNTQCCSAAECPAEGACVTYACEAGRCKKVPRPEGTPCGEGGVCNGPAEQCVQCLVVEDCGTKPCRTASCVEQACAWQPLPDGTACAEGGTQCCAGECADCCDVSDCPASGDPCATPQCLEGLCGVSCDANGTPCGAGRTCLDCTCQ